MKFTQAILALALFGTASAGRPNLTIQVRDGKFDNLDGLDPTLTWETSARSGDYDLEGGVDMAARPTADVASLPRSIWGKASTNVSGWGVSARADVNCSDMSRADVEIVADNSKEDISLKMLASAGNDSSVNSVEAVKAFNSGKARVTVNPRFDVASQSGDVVVNWDNGDTNVEATLSQEDQSVVVSQSMGKDTDVEVSLARADQKIKVSQQIDAQNRVTPSFSVGSGDMSVEWERDLGGDNSLTATLNPNADLDLEWKDDAWTANINMPIKGNAINGANVSIKREVNF